MSYKGSTPGAISQAQPRIDRVPTVVQRSKNQSSQGTKLVPLDAPAEVTEVGTGEMVAAAGHAVYVVTGAAVVGDGDDEPGPDGLNVSVTPSVVTTVGVVRPVGTVMVSDPMMIRPELDTMVWPFGNVEVTGPVGVVC